MTDSPSHTGLGFSSGFDGSFRQSASRRDSSVFGSPTSTISSAPSRMPLRTNPPSVIGTPKKRVTIRSDPTLITCFDASDKELYDLWAPKR